VNLNVTPWNWRRGNCPLCQMRTTDSVT
jgi:hypothetical protein